MNYNALKNTYILYYISYYYENAQVLNMTKIPDLG